MWLFLNDCFLSIVHKDCARDELLVRARREGDIEKLFPKAKVDRVTHADYLFRSVLKREEVERAMVEETRRITYGNFKDSVAERPLHDAYLRVWTTMASLQDPRPYSGTMFDGDADDIDLLNLSTRCTNALRNDGIYSVADIRLRSEAQLLSAPNFGRGALKEVIEALRLRGIKVGDLK